MIFAPRHKQRLQIQTIDDLFANVVYVDNGESDDIATFMEPKSIKSTNSM